MQIKRRLTYQFITIVAVILSISSISIYYFSAEYRQEEFYSRLHNKATNTAKLLLEVDEVDVDLLRRIERNTPVSLSNERLTIFNNKNEEIFSTEEDEILQPTIEILERIRLQKTIKYELGDYEVLGFLYMGEEELFVVLIAAIDVYGKNKIENLRTVLIVVFSLSILMVFISGWVYAERALRPINTVITQVDNIGISSLNLRVDEGENEDEIAKLANTFNNMLERLEAAFTMQKNFIANASHELRTPLAAITGQLEVVLMKDRDINEYKETIKSVLEDMVNMNNTSNRLLMLAQTSAENVEDNFGNVRVDEMLWSVQEKLKKHQEKYVIKLSLDDNLEEQQLTVRGNGQLIQTVFLNLIDNACKYSENRTAYISVTANSKFFIVSIRDEGIGIDPADLELIYNPFYRGDNTIIYKGSGIGLSLVHRIIQLHNGRIRVESELYSGTTFTVHIPHI